MPKSVTKESLSSTTNCRRSGRIACKIKSMAQGKSVSSEERPSSTKKRGKLLYRKKSAAKTLSISKGQSSSTKKRGKLPHRKSAAKTQPASTKELPSSTKESEKPSNSKKSVTKRQPESSDDEQSSSAKQAVKKRRVTEMDEIHERVSQMGLQSMQGFSISIREILRELSPNLTISEEAIAHMNIYLNYVFKRLARTTALFLLEKEEVTMTHNDIETAMLRVINGEIVKYCIAEGRRAIRKWNRK